MIPQFDELIDRVTRHAPALAAMSRMLCRSSGESAFGLPPAVLGTGSLVSAFVRPARLSFASQYGTLIALFDAQHFPALESIASDDNQQRRIALANLWFNAYMELARCDGLELLRVTDLVLCDRESHAVNPGLPLVFPHSTPPLCCVLTEVSPRLASEFLKRSDTRVLPERYSALKAIRLPGQLRIAQRVCPTRVLKTLRIGDVLLGWPVPYPATGKRAMAAQISWGAEAGMRLAASVEIQEHHVTLVTQPTMTHNAYEFTTDTEGAFEPPTAIDTDAIASDDDANDTFDQRSLDDLEVTVHLEINTLDLSLATLATLQPGYLLELPIPIEDAQVRLVVQRRTIGTGRLVAIGNHLGLQISRMVTA